MTRLGAAALGAAALGAAALGAAALGAAALALAALAGCGPPDAGVPGSGSEPVPVDSSLVDVLTDLALADARAELAPAPLRAIALGVHGVSPEEARDRQARLARDPAVARATYDAVERALMSEPR